MKTDEIFSGRRFMAVLRKFVDDNRTVLIVSGACDLGAMILIGVINAIAYREVYSSATGIFPELAFMSAVMLFTGCWLASLMFRTMRTRPGAVALLTQPASEPEKLAARLVIVAVAFPLWSLLCMWIGDEVKLIVSHQLFNSNLHRMPWTMFFNVNAASGIGGIGIGYSVMFTFWAIQSFHVLGSVFWKKNNYQWTNLALVGIAVVYISALVFIVEDCLGLYMGNVIPGMFYIRIIPFEMAIVAANYFITYVRLREKTVA